MNYKSIHSIRHYKTVLKWVIIKLVTKVIIKLVVELVVIKIVYTVAVSYTHLTLPTKRIV